jgi:GTPase SAR1 family protein
MAPIYYRGSQAAILVYDITNLDSFNDVRIWLEGRLAELHLSSS